MSIDKELKRKALKAAIKQINHASNRIEANKIYLIWKDAFQHNSLFKKAISEKKQKLNKFAHVNIKDLTDHYINFEKEIKKSFTKEILLKMIKIKDEVLKNDDISIQMTNQLTYFKECRKVTYDIDPENLDSTCLIFYIQSLITPCERDYRNGIINLIFIGAVK